MTIMLTSDSENKKRTGETFEKSSIKKSKTRDDALPPAPIESDPTFVSPEELHFSTSNQEILFYDYSASTHQVYSVSPSYHPYHTQDFHPIVTSAQDYSSYSASSSLDHHFGGESVGSGPSLSTFYSAPTQHQPHQQHQAPQAPVNNSLIAPNMLVNSDSFKPYRCDYPSCGKSYKKLNGLISHHYGTHTSADLADVKPYRCGAVGCDKRYRNTNGLAYHLENNHSFEDSGSVIRTPGTFFPSVENTLATPHSSNSSGDLQELTARELADDPGRKAFPCFLCDKIWRTSGGLSYHMTLSHPATPISAPHSVDQSFESGSGFESGSAFESGGAFESEQVFEEAVEPSYKCALCLTDFNGYNGLMEHMVEEHAASGAGERAEGFEA